MRGFKKNTYHEETAAEAKAKAWKQKQENEQNCSVRAGRGIRLAKLGERRSRHRRSGPVGGWEGEQQSVFK